MYAKKGLEQTRQNTKQCIVREKLTNVVVTSYITYGGETEHGSMSPPLADVCYDAYCGGTQSKPGVY